MQWDALKGFLRHFLTFAGGFAVQADFVPESELDTTVGAVITLIGLVWSYFDKKNRADEKKEPNL